MKALSLMQPWAWMMTHGDKHIPLKGIENRKWWTAVRGPVLVHASKTFDNSGLDFINLTLENLGFNPGKILPAKFEMGGIVGIFNITGVVTESDSPWFFGPYGFVVKDARPLPFMPLRGQLGFFDVPDDIVRQLGLDQTMPIG